ncbi:hypothetical protein NM688_g8043 [Phlebia brevispora]|uniref:Uncharacterized protein n=1 Tax=Phlebia brevispora TaxID=194682 RepID=A0ACC1RY55_9APHY|nr:hypothetical protein NM688_g8043 [Phlebia brevispora]
MECLTNVFIFPTQYLLVIYDIAEDMSTSLAVAHDSFSEIIFVSRQEICLMQDASVWFGARIIIVRLTGDHYVLLGSNAQYHCVLEQPIDETWRINVNEADDLVVTCGPTNSRRDSWTILKFIDLSELWEFANTLVNARASLQARARYYRCRLNALSQSLSTLFTAKRAPQLHGPDISVTRISSRSQGDGAGSVDKELKCRRPQQRTPW